MVVWVTGGGSDALVQAIRKAGGVAIWAPLLVAEPERSVLGDLRQECATAQPALLVSSSNVSWIFNELSFLCELPIYTVGTHTAQQLVELGCRDVRLPSGSAIGMEAICSRIRCEIDKANARLLYLSGDIVAEDPAPLLKDAPITVRRYVVYQMHAVQEVPEVVRENASDIRVVVLQSMRVAAAVRQILEAEGCELSQLVALCQSARIAQAVQQDGYGRVLIAPTADRNGLLEALKQASLPSLG